MYVVEICHGKVSSVIPTENAEAVARTLCVNNGILFTGLISSDEPYDAYSVHIVDCCIDNLPANIKALI